MDSFGGRGWRTSKRHLALGQPHELSRSSLREGHRIGHSCRTRGQLGHRAGAYLDNTDIGEVIFDFLGHSESGDLNAVGINAAVVRDAAPAGSLRLSVEASTPVVLAGEGSTLAGELPEATVLDSRNDVQAQGNGWTLSGTARDFVAGNRSFGAAALAWAPRIIASESGASSGAITTLEAPAVLASADLESRVGSTVVGADLTLTVPADAKAGNYGSEITLSLFAQD